MRFPDVCRRAPVTLLEGFGQGVVWQIFAFLRHLSPQNLDFLTKMIPNHKRQRTALDFFPLIPHHTNPVVTSQRSNTSKIRVLI